MSEEWIVLCGGNVVYASRPSRAEADQVRDEQYDLAKKFGLPVTVERRVIPAEAAFESRVRAEARKVADEMTATLGLPDGVTVEWDETPLGPDADAAE